MLNGKIKRGSIFIAVEDPEDATVAVDDIIDTGRTASIIHEEHGLKTFALVDRLNHPERAGSAEWVVFPWEGASGQEDDKLSIVTRMLQVIGEDASRDGLRDTPRRVVDSMGRDIRGIRLLPGATDGDAYPVSRAGQSRLFVEGIRFTSTCEHHLMPYSGEVSIRYSPSDGVIGLSKLPRIVQLLSHRLTIQETLTQDILDVISSPSLRRLRLKSRQPIVA